MSLVYNYIVTALCQIKKYFSDSYQEKLEQGLYNGILKALGEQYKKSGYATPDFCSKKSVKYPSTLVNTRDGGFVILSFFYGDFSTFLCLLKFFLFH